MMIYADQSQVVVDIGTFILIEADIDDIERAWHDDFSGVGAVVDHRGLEQHVK